MGAQPDGLVNKLARSSEVGIAIVVVGIVLMLDVPMPPDLLDVFLAFNLACAIITLIIDKDGELVYSCTCAHVCVCAFAMNAWKCLTSF